ncbi:UDP-N-acetylmuramoyl-L-alanyl-D-glutamate--2,6-diaminopimelate ligase [Brachybacterium avium]|uniref:UDP-N-acetylmuramoyl-L-alanyl-D-glutamate--2,6-diaminopimelate ligase n=2 Tax=Brachybacterium avium TaxID=2017485 RepID=A0A220UFG0_9MICO|nr:UDP-N-acetylmuramoyl-L-alanyl-D-glutamate--2,6-diaminopimelate ligase [Brachybacterium avium]ASK66632.1 UDP-N-acetylmuramoyl-L-alanyl-D-glutamate--2,6-diaminopimelate ligase [Brachybacterium avium]
MTPMTDPALEPARPRHAHGATAGDLARALGAPMPGASGSEADPVLCGVTLDSRSVEPGDLWCALPGANAHGAQFAQQAADLGAAMALTDPTGRERCEAAGLPVLVVQDPRTATATAAALVQGRPAARLVTIGVTGTNGKTSITTAITRTLLELGVPAGAIGTSGTSYRDVHGTDHAIGTVRTTPEAPELHGLLARMVEDDVEVVSMEVSSHALVLHRADEVVYDIACFTNLTQDHLDFHGSMERYFQAKRLLFTPEHARRGIVCVDDDWGRRLAREALVPVTTYTTKADVEADHRAGPHRPEGYGSTFEVEGPGGTRTLRAALPGRHYVANTLAVDLLLAAIGHTGEEVTEALGRAGTVPGRMESVAAAPIRGIVDYSHTPDALEQALTTLRGIPGTGRLLVVMGAGGDRDRGKRPRMGEVAARLADVVVVTDDNPRSEDPAAIRREVLSGVPDDANALVHDVDGRGKAIALAAYLADVSDTILVAGKGAETGQQIGGIVHPFDDRLRLRDALRDAHTARGGADDMDEGR